MKRLSILLIIFLVSKNVSGQISRSDLDNLYEKFKSKGDKFKLIKLKSLNVYSYKNDNSKKGKLVLLEEYDTNGNVIRKIDHHFYRYRDFEEYSYTYDSLARIQTIVSKGPFSDGYINYTALTYYKDKVKFILTDYGIPSDLKFDTFYYTFYPDGRLKSRIESKYGGTYHSNYILPSYYHYNKYGDTFVDDNEHDTIVDFIIRNKNGCIIGYSDTSESKYTMVRDSSCNLIQFNQENWINGKWVLIDKSEYKYDNHNNTIENKHYNWIRNINKGKLKLESHTCYEYNDKDLIIKETSFNKKGQISEVKKYIYEIYKN